MIGNQYHTLTPAELWEKYLAAKKAEREVSQPDKTAETYGRRAGQKA